MGFGPFAVKGRVVSNPIDDHFHAQFVSGGRQCLQIFLGPKVRIDLVVILNTVRASQARRTGLNHVVITVLPTFPVDFTDRVNRHQPQNVNA